MVRRLLMLVVTAMAMACCAFEDRIGVPGGGMATICMSLADARTNVDADDEVGSLRVMAFAYLGGACKYNKVYDMTGTDELSLTLPVGRYSFVFVANEPQDDQSITNTLDDVGVRADMNSVAFGAKYFVSSRNIPMYRAVDNVGIHGENSVSIDATMLTTDWVISMERLGARVDMVLESIVDLDAAFKGVEFTNLPDRVGLTPDYSGHVIRNVSREFLAADARYFKDGADITYPDDIDSNPDAVWKKKLYRVILPSNDFSDTDDPSKAITLSALMEGGYNPSGKIGLSIAGEAKNYTLPRNWWFDGVGTITNVYVETNTNPEEFTIEGYCVATTRLPRWQVIGGR